MSNAIAIILAAGKSKRMMSETPKVLHPACGRPIVEYVLDAARAAGFLAHSAKGNAATLTAYLFGQNITGPLWHIHGFDTRGDIAQTLTSGGLVTFSVPAYRQIPASLSPEAVALFAQDAPLIVPLFSPNSARLFVAEYQKIASKAPLWIAALSEAVLRETRGVPTAKHVVAAQPNAQEMLLSLSPWLDDDSYP